MGPLYVLAAVLLWSFVPLMLKQLLGVFSPYFIGMMRLLLAGIFIGVMQSFEGQAPLTIRPRLGAGKRWAWLLAAGAGISGNYVLYVAGLRHTTASAANILIQIEVIGLAVLGMVVLKETIRGLKLAGTLSALIGVLLVAWNGERPSAIFHSPQFLGSVVLMIAGLSWSLYGLGQKILLRDYSPAQSLLGILFIGALLAALPAFAGRPITGAPTALQWAYLFVLGVISTGASYLLLARGMALAEASSVAVLTSTLPLMTMVEAHFILREPFTPYLLLGAVFTVAGIVLIVLSPAPARQQ